MIQKIWRKSSTPNCKNEEAVFEKLYHLFDKLFTLNHIMIYEMYRIFLFCSSANRYMYILEYVSYKGCNLTWILVDVWRIRLYQYNWNSSKIRQIHIFFSYNNNSSGWFLYIFVFYVLCCNFVGKFKWYIYQIIFVPLRIRYGLPISVL